MNYFSMTLAKMNEKVMHCIKKGRASCIHCKRIGVEFNLGHNKWQYREIVFYAAVLMRFMD